METAGWPRLAILDGPSVPGELSESRSQRDDARKNRSSREQIGSASASRYNLYRVTADNSRGAGALNAHDRVGRPG